MQTKRPTGSDPSFAPIPFPPLPPFSDRPPVFTPPALIVPEKKSENDCAFISCAPASSYTYVPTIPRVPVFRSRFIMPAPAPLPPPPSPPPLPPVAAGADYIGPLHPVLTDGKHRFRVEGLIAMGGYGRVALASVEGVATPSSKVAIKVYCKDKLIVNRMLLETYDVERAIMLENAIHDCQWLVKLRGTFGDLWNRYLVMDYYPNSLSGIIFDPEITPLPRYIVRHWVEELTLGMYELYNRGVVHCDLKPGNILVSPKGHLAIADFGISLTSDEILDADRHFDECEFISYGGTYPYQAPELLISHHATSFTCAVDMWSFGVIIFEMYTNRRLFSTDALDVRNEVWAWDIPAMVRREIDDELARDLVIELLEVEPEKRLKMRDVGEHPYFQNTDWRKVANKSISIDFYHAELSSCSWRDSLRFEKPVTPDSLIFGSS
ncbi:kinase-like domain-containing protein [Russula emetica]|nr:kinase-like domain-containing protein [Russula emetica]